MSKRRKRQSTPVAIISQDVPGILGHLVFEFNKVPDSDWRRKWKRRILITSDDGRTWDIKVGSQRYRLFNDNRTCVVCGVEGVLLGVMEAHATDTRMSHHLNLYGLTEDGDLVLMTEDGDFVLMTKDHIVPKSRGGADLMSNYQMMCCTCNVVKGNKQFKDLELRCG